VDCMISTQPFRDQGYSFQGKELAHELCIPLSNGGHLKTAENIASAKRLGNESSPVSSEFHQLVDEQFHRMDSAARTCVAHAALWQEDMIHAAAAQHRVVHADRNTGPKQCVDDRWRLAGRNIADVEPHPMPDRRVDAMPRRFGCRDKIALDAQVIHSATMLSSVRAWVGEDVDHSTSLNRYMV